MEGSWRGILAMLVVLIGLAASGSSYQIIDGPKNATVLQGSEARFNCTVSPGWKLIMWTLKDIVVLSITPQESIVTNNRFTAESYDLDGNFVSEMLIHDVQLSDEGLIICSLQNSDLTRSAYLSVQVMGTLHIPSDSLLVIEDEPCNVTCQALGWTPLPDITWTVDVPVSHSGYFSSLEPGDGHSAVSVLTLTPQGNGTLTCVADLRSLQASTSVTVNLTVVQHLPDSIDRSDAALPTWAIILLAVSFSLLLILIIVLIIIFCCCCVSGKNQQESSYQNEVRKSANVKTDKGVLGNENHGYHPDEPKPAKAASLPPKSNVYSIPEQRSRSRPFQEPAKHQPNPGSRPQVSFSIASPQKVRNVTIV
ncbi:immunoglobulin superfamily member 5 isoform X1 [Castor canadensis]|uniref:immunoglobulin superfamily member 5 isoform X1 n=1 Tax=Castor canadensis TaxID=51338 RepID=UPI003D174CF6